MTWNLSMLAGPFVGAAGEVRLVLPAPVSAELERYRITMFPPDLPVLAGVDCVCLRFEDEISAMAAMPGLWSVET